VKLYWAVMVGVLVAAVGAAGAGEAVKGYTHTAEVIVRGAEDAAAIEFYPGVKIASPPAIVNERGNVVSSEVLLNQEGGKLLLVFDTSGGGGRYVMHYGGRGAAAWPAKPWSATPSLLMEVRSMPRGAVSTWGEMQKLLRQSEGMTQGMMFVPNIFHAYNPFGPQDEFITIYRGELVTDKDLTCKFFTASSDASFVVIDGKMEFDWPGRHDVHKGRWGKFGKKIRLAKGRHTIEYYHVQLTGTPYMALGYYPPGDKAPRPVPAGMFAHTPVAEVRNCRRKDGGPTARFTWTQGRLLRYDQYEYVRYDFRNVSAGADAVEWEFCDGVTSTEPNPTHVFTGKPPYQVRLRATKGAESDTFIVLVPRLTPMENDVVSDAETVKEFVGIIRRYPFDKLPGAMVGAFFELMDTIEKPLELAPICEVIVDKYSVPGVDIRARKILARAYSITEPKKAIPLLQRLMNSRDPVTALEARARLIEIHLHRFRDYDWVIRHAANAVDGTPKGSPIARLAMVKAADVYLLQGDIEKAEAKYMEVQQLAFAGMSRREIAVRQGGYAETVNSLLLAGRYREARRMLVQWEIDFPISKIQGDYILMNSRYWEAVGDYRMALDGMECLLKINPLTPYLPQIEFRMGKAYAALGEKDKARELFEKVVKEYPLNPVAHEAQSALHDLR